MVTCCICNNLNASTKSNLQQNALTLLWRSYISLQIISPAESVVNIYEDTPTLTIVGQKWLGERYNWWRDECPKKPRLLSISSLGE